MFILADLCRGQIVPGYFCVSSSLGSSSRTSQCSASARRTAARIEMLLTLRTPRSRSEMYCVPIPHNVASCFCVSWASVRSRARFFPSSLITSTPSVFLFLHYTPFCLVAQWIYKSIDLFFKVTKGWDNVSLQERNIPLSTSLK